MTSGLGWKRDAKESLERRRRFFSGQMRDSVLAVLPVEADNENDWAVFEKKWGTFAEGESRLFPSNEEILERTTVGLERRGRVEDDWLPVAYSILDAGESMVGAMFGKPVRFLEK